MTACNDNADGGKQCNNQPTTGEAKAGGGDGSGGDGNSNGSGSGSGG